jgi:DNA primase
VAPRIPTPQAAAEPQRAETRQEAIDRLTTLQPSFLSNLDLARAHVTAGGSFLVAKSMAKEKPLYRKGKWYTVHTASGTLISSRDGDDTKRDATEFADLLEQATTADGNTINWGQFTTGDELRYTQSVPGYAYDDIYNKTGALFQAQRAAADDAALEAQRPTDPDPRTGPFRRRDDLLAYWAEGADPALPEAHRNALRNVATQNPETVHLSADGQFALISAPLGWLVLTARSGTSLIPASDPNHQARTTHPTRKAAEGWAALVATLRDADGNPLNWAAPDIRPDDRGSDRGESWKLAFLRIDAEHAAQFGDQHRNAERRYELERERTDNNGAGTGRIWGREIQDGTELRYEADPTLPERVLSITHRTDDQITLLTTAGPRTVGADERVPLATAEPQRSAANDEGQALGTRVLPFELEAGQRVQLQTPASTLYGRVLLSEAVGASHLITLWATVTSVSPDSGEIRLDGVRLWDGSGRPLARTDDSTTGLRQFDNEGRPLVQTSDSVTFTLSDLDGLGQFVQLDDDAPEPRDKYAHEVVPRPETPEPHEITPQQMQPGDHVTLTVGPGGLEWPDSTRGLAKTPEEVRIQGLVSPSHDGQPWRSTTLLQATLTDAQTGEVLAADEPHVLITRLPTTVLVDPSQYRDDLRPEPRRADQVRIGDLVAHGRTGLAVTDIFHVTNRTPHIGLRFGDGEYPYLPEAGEELAVVPRERRRPEDLARLLRQHPSISAMQLDMKRITGPPNSLLARLKEEAEQRSEIVPGLSAALDEVEQALAPLKTAGNGAEGCRERAAALRAALPLVQRINAELPLPVRTQSGIGEHVLDLCTALDVQAQRLDADVAYLEQRAAERATAKETQTQTTNAALQTATPEAPTTTASNEATPAEPKPADDGALFAVDAVSTPTRRRSLAEDLADEPSEAVSEGDAPSSTAPPQGPTAAPPAAASDTTVRSAQRRRRHTPAGSGQEGDALFGMPTVDGADAETGAPETPTPEALADVVSDPGGISAWDAEGGRPAAEPEDGREVTGPAEHPRGAAVEITADQTDAPTRGQDKDPAPERTATPVPTRPRAMTPPTSGRVPGVPSSAARETPAPFRISEWPQIGRISGRQMQAWRRRGAALPPTTNAHTDPRAEATRHITDPKVRSDARALLQQLNPLAEFDAALTSALSRTRNSSVRALASQAGQALRQELAACADEAREQFLTAMTAPGILHYARGYGRDVPTDQAYQRSHSAFIHAVEQAEDEARRRGLDADAVTAVLADAAGWDGSINDGRLLNTRRLNAPVHAAYRSAQDRLAWMLQRVGWLDKHNKARAALQLSELQPPPPLPGSTTDAGFWPSLDTAQRRYTRTPRRDLSALAAAYLTEDADQGIGQTAWEEAYPLAQFEENARAVLDQLTDTEEHRLVGEVQRALHADLMPLFQDTTQEPPTISQLAAIVAGHRSRAADEAEMLGLDPAQVCSHLDYVTGWDGSIAITPEGTAVANYTTVFTLRAARTATGTPEQRRRRRELVAQLPDPNALLTVLTALEQPADPDPAPQAQMTLISSAAQRPADQLAPSATSNTPDPEPHTAAPKPAQPTTEPMEKPMAAPPPAAQPARAAQPRTPDAPQTAAGRVVVLTVNGNSYTFQELAADRLGVDVRNALHHGGAPAQRVLYGHIGKAQLPLFWEATPAGIVFTLEGDAEPVLTVAPTEMAPSQPNVSPRREESPYLRLVAAIAARLEATGQTAPPGPRLVPQEPIGPTAAARADAQRLGDAASQAADGAALEQITAQSDEQGLSEIPVNTHGPLGVVQLGVWLQAQRNRIEADTVAQPDDADPTPEADEAVPAPQDGPEAAPEPAPSTPAPTTPRTDTQSTSSTEETPRSRRATAPSAGAASEPDQEPNREPVDKERVYDALEAALPLFEQALAAPEAATAQIHLAEKRGITEPAEARRWNLGYAPAGPRTRKWRAITNELRNQGFTKDELVAAGLLNITASGKEVDQFIDSVVLPIRDEQGRVISFIGRALDPKAIEDYGKYRSKNTLVFKKGEQLYGPDGWQATAARGGPIYLSEGPFDANANTAALDAIGHADAERPGVSVAPCGTALTTNHIAELAALHDGPQPLVFVLDNDRGGQDALLRQAALAAEWDGPVHAVFMDGAKDPDELRLKQGDAALHRALTEGSVPLDEALAQIVELRAAETLKKLQDEKSLLPPVDAAHEIGMMLGAARLPEATVIKLALHLQDTLEMGAEHTTYAAFTERNPHESADSAFRRASEAIHQVMEERQRAQQATHSQEELPIMAVTDTAEPAQALPAEQLAADLEPVIQAAESNETAPATAAPASGAAASSTPIRERLVAEAQEADATLAAAGEQVTLTVPLDLQPLMQEFETLTALESRTVLERPPLREDQRYRQILLLVAAANAALTAIRTDTSSSEHTRQRRQAALTSTVARAISINSTAISEELAREGVRNHPVPETLRALTRAATDTADQAAGILEPGASLTHYLTVTREMDKLVTALEALAPPNQRHFSLPSWPEALTWDALRHSLPTVRRSPAAQVTGDLTRRWTRLDAALERFQGDRRLNGLGRTLKIRSAEMIAALAGHLAEVSERKGNRLSTALWQGVHHWASETVDLLRGRISEGETREPGYYADERRDPVYETAIQQARAAWKELEALDPDDPEAPTLRAGIHARALLARLSYTAQRGESNGLDVALDPSERIGFLLKNVDGPERIGEWSRIRTAVLELAETLSERNPRRELLHAWAERIHQTISGDTTPDPASASRLTATDIQAFARRALATQEPSPLVLADDPETFERAQHALAVMERMGIVSASDATHPEGPSRRAMLITDPDQLEQVLLGTDAELAAYRASLPTGAAAEQAPTAQAVTSPAAEANAAEAASPEVGATPSEPDGPSAEPPASAAPTAGQGSLTATPPSAEPQSASGPATPEASPEKPASAPEPERSARQSNQARLASLLKDSGERVNVLNTQRPQATGPAVTPIRPQDQAAQQTQQPLARAAGAGRG